MEFESEIIERWESLGLLDGLQLWEKEELALIYDNATKIILSVISINNKIDTDFLDQVYIPICRRLYRRVGPNFNLENMVSKLIETISSGDFNNNLEKNSVIEFCVSFSDLYEDEETNKKYLNEDEYELRVSQMISTIKEVLLNKKMVSYVNKEDNGFKINLSKTEKTKQQTRFWNQSVAKKLFDSALSEINKGL
jgi:hypothetical protein